MEEFPTRGCGRSVAKGRARDRRTIGSSRDIVSRLYSCSPVAEVGNRTARPHFGGRHGHGVKKPLMKPSTWTMFALALMAPAVSASDLASLIDLPVAGSALVPASQYRDASSRAVRTGSPVDIALGVTGAFEGARQLIVQTNEGAESPSASRVTVIRDGLLDDAVRTERWDFALARTPAGTWEIRQVTKAWRCWRGGKTAGFAAQPCP